MEDERKREGKQKRTGMIMSNNRSLLVGDSSTDLGSERVEGSFETEQNGVALLLSPRRERVEIPGADEEKWISF